MAKIHFRGKTYNTEVEMPPDIRKAYNDEKTRAESLSDLVDMSPEVKEIYERALGNVEDGLPTSRTARELPRTEDIYRQSAPDDMKHLPSDESIYRPSQPLIDPSKSAIEPEPAFGMNRFVSSIVWALLLIVVAFFITQFLF